MKTPKPKLNARREWECEHGVGHGRHVHGCDGCCDKDGMPKKKN